MMNWKKFEEACRGPMQSARTHTHRICVLMGKETNNVRTAGLRAEFWAMELQNPQQLVCSLRREFRLDCLFNELGETAGLCYGHSWVKRLDCVMDTGEGKGRQTMYV
jgi:hypothetical protein